MQRLDLLTFQEIRFRAVMAIILKHKTKRPPRWRERLKALRCERRAFVSWCLSEMA